MRIYIIYSGPYGEQIIENLASKGLATSIVGVFELTPELIEEEHQGEADLWDHFWEEPERYIPQSLPPAECDLLIVLGIHGRLGDLVPYIAERLRAKAVLYTISDSNQLPEARKTIEEELRSRGIHLEFLEPFCVLANSENEYVREFARRFGRPRFEIRLDPEQGTILEARVVRDTPCGSASCVASKLVGLSIRDRAALAKKLYDEHHNEGAENYCLAEMDPHYPLMQEAGDLLKDAVFEACGLPTTKDTILARVQELGEVQVEELRRLVVGEPGAWEDPNKACDADRTFNLYLEELVQEGLLALSGGVVKPALKPPQRVDSE